jgi:hypothetical protein
LKSFRNKLIAHHDRFAVFGDEQFVHKIEQGDLPELLESIIDLFSWPLCIRWQRVANFPAQEKS